GCSSALPCVSAALRPSEGPGFGGCATAMKIPRKLPSPANSADLRLFSLSRSTNVDVFQEDFDEQPERFSAWSYRKTGLEMLHEHAQFEDGSVSVEAGLQDMLIRMETGRFKVLKHLTDWFDEFRLYHRKDGKVHKEGDDLMSATRYAVMMLRYAET